MNASLLDLCIDRKNELQNLKKKKKKKAYLNTN